MNKVFFAAIAAAVCAASADTVYTWTGQVKAADNYYHFDETGNWDGGTVPTSGDDVILDFGTISAARNLKNDLVGLRIRGYRINADPSAAIVNIYGNKLTLVGTGGGTNDCDSIRAGGGPFYLHTDVEIVGDYYYKTTGGAHISKARSRRIRPPRSIRMAPPATSMATGRGLRASAR